MDLAILGVLFAAMYFILIVPKQRQQKKQDQMIASLAAGDEILLNSGLFGFISSVEDSILWVEVAENVELKVTKSSVAGLVSNDDDDEDEA